MTPRGYGQKMRGEYLDVPTNRYVVTRSKIRLGAVGMPCLGILMINKNTGRRVLAHVSPVITNNQRIRERAINKIKTDLVNKGEDISKFKVQIEGHFNTKEMENELRTQGFANITRRKEHISGFQIATPGKKDRVPKLRTFDFNY